ncbi:unnamed protein product [Vicia faba]|uniref:Glutamyl-tRNA reductase n=1 Tax=Vicia faba TaxID=3906 RepID=A0AAV1AT27_VICFA|nr:unnamed protein product [Vicia faba]CAI8613462.1 unnamed protein product [Vicia faba]
MIPRTQIRPISDVSSDLTIEIGASSLSLHKFPLVSRSGRIRKLLLESRDSKVSRISFPSVPGGAEAFELAAKFCYGINIEFTLSNVSMLRCIAHFLEMTEEFAEKNLLTRAESYLKETVLSNTANTISALHRCETLLPISEEIKLVNRLVNSIANNVCKEQLTSGLQKLDHSFSSRILEPETPSEWWGKSLNVLNLDFFKRVLSTLKLKGLKQEIISKILINYAHNLVLQTSGIPASELSQYLFLLYNKDATQHLFEVSAGLDSLVMGEGQILAQVKQVVKAGQGVNGFGRNISGLFKHAITVGKRVRTETNISAGAVSVSSAAVELAVMKLPDQASHGNARMLVIGAGKMGKLVIKHLVAKGCKKMVVVNRTEERVSAIRDEINDVEIIYKPLSDMLECVGEADVVFSSTASENPLILKQHVKELPFASEEMGRKRLFVDISVPRNVGSCVDDLESVKVYNVDNLKEVVAANKEDRLRKAMEAQVIIGEESGQFEAWRDSLETVPTIKKLRAYAERLRIIMHTS